MSLVVAMDLAVCGALLAGLSTLAQYLGGGAQGATLLSGLVGGALCVLWAILGRRGTHCRGVAMATLAAVAFVLVGQAVRSWGPSGEGESNERMVVAVLGVMVVCCVGMVLILAGDGKGPER